MNQEKIGNFIREMRNEKKMTQQELAEKIGVTDRAISKFDYFLHGLYTNKEKIF